MEKAEKISILQDIIKIKSVNGNEEEVAKYIQNLLQKHGIDSELVEYASGRSSLVAKISAGEGKVLALSGHMDVVDAGDESLWQYPPFEAKIDGNKLYGRGSTDMKSGLAAMVIAMIEAKEQGLLTKGTVKLLATVGEEVGELGAEDLTKKGYADDLDALVIGEPTNYNLMYAHMGSINYSVVSIGKEAHSSMPDQGINAIDHLNLFITEVNTQMEKIANDYVSDVLGRTIHNVTVINGGNQVNSIPGNAKLQGNIRSIPEYDNQKIIDLLQSIVDRLNKESTVTLKLTIDYNKLPVQTDKDSALIQTIQKVMTAKTGKELPLVTAAGTTDTAEFIKAKKSFDFVVYGPGVPTLPHQVNEYVEIDNYLDMIDIYKEIIQAYL